MTAEDISVTSYSSPYGHSYAAANYNPFTVHGGIKVVGLDIDNPAIPFQAQGEAGNVSVDVADVEYADAIRLRDEGLFAPIDPPMLPPAPYWTPASEDFLLLGLSDCAMGSIVFSTIITSDRTPPHAQPQSLDDFLGTQKLPDKRGIKNMHKAVLEMTLMGDSFVI